MKNYKEKSILLKELEENEECELEYKEGKLFLNNKDITNIKNELFKLLKQSILSLQKSLEQQQIKLKNVFGKEMLTSKIVKSTKYLNTKTYYKNESLWNNRDNNKSKKQKNDLKKATIPEETQIDSQNNIIDKLQENILIQQYYSIISIESIIAENKYVSQIKLNGKQPQQQKQEIFKKNQEINLNQISSQEMRLSTQDSPEIIKFVSPLNKSKNKIQTLDLEYYQEIQILEADLCDLCYEKNNLIQKMNTILQNIEKEFIFELCYIQIGIDQYCDHLEEYQNEHNDIYFYPNLYLEFGNLSNLKYHKLLLNTADFIDMEQYNNPNHRFKIIQDEYLKYLEFDILFLPFIQVKQKQDQYLSCLTIQSINCDNFNWRQISEYLNKICFSEFKIIFIGYLYSEKFRNQESINHIPLIQIIIDEDAVVEDEEKQTIQIINEKYTHTLCFFTLHKLFNDDFSIFRLAYDLYEEI